MSNLGWRLLKNLLGLWCERKFALDIIEQFGLLEAKLLDAPISSNHGLSKEDDVSLEDPTIYIYLVGKLKYFTLIRPDLAYAVEVLSQFMGSLTQTHLEAMLKVLRYVKGTSWQRIYFSVDPDLNVTGYNDSDWAGCWNTKRSLTGFCVFLCSPLVSWNNKKQQIVSRSSAKAEYRAMVISTCELVWLEALLRDFNVKVHEPILIYCNTQSAMHITRKSAMHITRNPVFHERA